MEQYAGKDMGGSNGSASESNCWKLFSLLWQAAISVAHVWELYLVSSRCPRSATRVLFSGILSSVASADTLKF